MNKILFAITLSSCFLFVKSIVWNATTSYSFLFCAAMPWQPPRDWLQAYHKSPGLCFRKDSDWCYSHFFFSFFYKKKEPSFRDALFCGRRIKPTCQFYHVATTLSAEIGQSKVRRTPEKQLFDKEHVLYFFIKNYAYPKGLQHLSIHS